MEAASSTASAPDRQRPAQPRLAMVAWDRNASSWTTGGADDDRPVAECSDTTRLRLATLNILADCFPLPVRLATLPKHRIAAAIERIVALQPDVLGLNEVTPNILAQLQGDPRIRARFVCTHTPDNLRLPHSCAVLVRRGLPVTDVSYLAAISDDPEDGETVEFKQARLPVAVTVAGLTIVSVHTMAYQRADTRAVRKRQIAAVSSQARALGRPFVVLGDLNLHDVCEDSVVVDNGLLDVWAETHPTALTPDTDGFRDASPEAGFTFDAVRNKMIPRYIPGERRRMRLDRILISQHAPWRPAAPCRVWADEPVSTARELFISDHFGLYVDLQPSDADGWSGSDQVAAALRANAARDPLPNPFSMWRFCGAMVFHTPWLGLRAAGFL